MAEPPKSDPLADTATAGEAQVAAVPGSGGAPRAIGRYAIAGELGHGAMGVVYAARDPDLERRIALKVLRASDSESARARLLREARAMARLSHPAVVTVHEVGTAAGVDYVAMELIDGSTVAEWIASASPVPDEILDVFETAGRGLAAAHAAGLVHRDFKPHNVLRSKRGRVVVTDFGLARAALDEPEAGATASGGGFARDAAVDAGSLSSTLTATGALLGTPAYMAPEQHDAAAVGPQADQFAYCVALWEALAGARPFPGQTLAAVRQQIANGPDPDGEAKIPRRLRPVLRRGLAVDPAARFPAMDALLAAIRRARRGRLWIAAAIAGALALAAGVAVIATRGGGAAPAPAVADGCGPPDRELAAFRHAAVRATLTSADGVAALADIDRTAGEWVETQRKVCANRADPDYTRRATCLRALRGRLEATLDALGELTPDELRQASPGSIAGDPLPCADPAGPPTRVVIAHSPVEHAVHAALLGDRKRREATADPGADQPCLRGWLLMAQMVDYDDRPGEAARKLMTAASEAADRCGDDRLAAGITLVGLASDVGFLVQDPRQIRRVEAAVARSHQDRFLISVADLLEGVMASFRGDYDDAITKATASIDQAGAIGARWMLVALADTVARWRMARSGPGDLPAAEQLLRDAIALVGPDGAARYQNTLIELLVQVGRIDDARGVLAERRDPGETPPPGAIAIAGRVLDAAGKPVAGARVVALGALSAHPGLLEPTAPALATAISAADGSFTIAAAAPDAYVMAEAPDGARTRPVKVKAATAVALRVPAEGSAFGHLTRTGTGLGSVRVAAQLPGLDAISYVAPVGADGWWRLDHVPRGKARMVVAWGTTQRNVEYQDVVIGAAPVGPIELAAAPRGVAVQVIMRSEVAGAIGLGIVVALRGKATAKVFSDLDKLDNAAVHGRAYPVEPSAAPEAVRRTLEATDVLVRLDGIAPGTTTFCGVGLIGPFNDSSYTARIDRHIAEMDVGCVTVDVTTTDQVVVVPVPPMKRLPED